MMNVSFGCDAAVKHIPDLKERVLTGTKKQTLRLCRCDGKVCLWHSKKMKKGAILKLYWKLRTKECEFLKNVVITEKKEYWFWKKDGVFLWSGNGNYYGEAMPTHEATELARRDGFNSPEDMFAFLDEVYDLSKPQRFVCLRWEAGACGLPFGYMAVKK